MPTEQSIAIPVYYNERESLYDELKSLEVYLKTLQENYANEVKHIDKMNAEKEQDGFTIPTTARLDDISNAIANSKTKIEAIKNKIANLENRIDDD